MKAKVTSVRSIPSKYGGTAKMITFKRLDDGKSARSWIHSLCGNSARWQNVKPGHILDGLIMKGSNLVDADSEFHIVGFEEIVETKNEVSRGKVA